MSDTKKPGDDDDGNAVTMDGITVAEAERILPKLNVTSFPIALSTKGGHFPIEQTYGMLNLTGWRLVGWQLAANVGYPREGCRYVCLCQYERNEGERYWCHFGDLAFINLVRLIRRDPRCLYSKDHKKDSASMAVLEQKSKIN